MICKNLFAEKGKEERRQNEPIESSGQDFCGVRDQNMFNSKS